VCVCVWFHCQDDKHTEAEGRSVHLKVAKKSVNGNSFAYNCSFMFYCTWNREVNTELYILPSRHIPYRHSLPEIVFPEVIFLQRYIMTQNVSILH
jgi:hypothetical protein